MLLGIITCTSCFNAKTIKTSSQSADYNWGFRWSYMDSIGNHTQGVSANRNCFPGFEQYENNFKTIMLEIYDDRGTLQYNSSIISENWICNEEPNTKYKKGNYFYILVVDTFNNPSKKDTITGQIVLY